jgi:tetratricopeptide (TPR) repeat protein
MLLGVGFCLAMLAGARSLAATNAIAPPAKGPPTAVQTVDPAEQEYRKLLADDDAAQAEVDAWIQENEKFSAEGADFTSVTLNARIARRITPVREAYEAFLDRHPQHVRARLAYGSFLNDVGLDDEALTQWIKARDIDPKNPATWNNLADYYSRHGPTRSAFECLEEARRLKPSEAVYCRNLATLVFLYRPEAQEYFHLADEQQVLRRALELFQKARRLDPENFTLATDLAQVYYQLKPEKADTPAQTKAWADKLTDEALRAWIEARGLARNDLDREGIAVHLARICLAASRTDLARQYLSEIKHPGLAGAKQALERELTAKP